jgi:hypothetical protein
MWTSCHKYIKIITKDYIINCDNEIDLESNDEMSVLSVIVEMACA